MLNSYLYRTRIFIAESFIFCSSSFQSTGNFQMLVLFTVTNNYCVKF